MKLVEEIRLNPTDTMPSQLKVNGVAYNVTQDYEKAKLSSEPVAVGLNGKWFLVSKGGVCPVGDTKPVVLPKTQEIATQNVEKYQEFIASFDKPREPKHEDSLLSDIMEELEGQHPPIAPPRAKTYVPTTQKDDTPRVTLDIKVKGFDAQVKADQENVKKPVAPAGNTKNRRTIMEAIMRDGYHTK
ncbi:MAG: hypothetical protein J6C90_02160 [Clostridia bacterium]|nr:hypothetical protein [Clostridia bacterium]